MEDGTNIFHSFDTEENNLIYFKTNDHKPQEIVTINKAIRL